MNAAARDPDVFSAGARIQLTDALTQYLATWNEERHDVLRAALERLCTEAHEKQLGPEQMLVLVKAAWASVPEGRTLDPDRRRIAFERVLGYCLDAYYGAE